LASTATGLHVGRYPVLIRLQVRSVNVVTAADRNSGEHADRAEQPVNFRRICATYITTVCQHLRYRNLIAHMAFQGLTNKE
jgi:hypothetical protein